MVKILHLSDLHFCNDAQASNMKNILLDEARAVHDLPLGEKLLIITGDFHNFWDTDYAFALNFIGELVDAMNIDPTQDVFIIPGNHDVANDMTLKQISVDKKQILAAVNMLKTGNMDFIEWRLQSFIPYCQFARDIGVYNDADKVLPAKVHVRRWRDKLNILHLNTALVADGKTKDNQIVDIDAAISDETWKQWYADDIPALALGHNSFFDLEEKQRLALATMFSQRNVSAYLCGDTHRANINIHTQRIPLQYGMTNKPLMIPNIVCVKGVSENGDSYSDFGYSRHEWDEKTGHVDLRYQRWRPEFLSKTIRDDTGSGYYDMLTKEKSVDFLPLVKQSDYDLKQYLDNLLRKTRDNHPSFVLLRKDGIDARLFPEVEEFSHEALGKIDGTEPVSPVWNIIRDSWKADKKHNIVIEGGGGIGKTIALFSVTNIKYRAVPPAIYVPMHRLVNENGTCVKLADYLAGLSKQYGSEILKLADSGWVNGPKLLLLLDGFNEVPANNRRTILHMLNDWQDCSGTQLIAVSRPMDGMNLKADLADDPIAITLQPLSREVVREYLGDKTPPDSSRLWDVLTFPLFLTLYVKTEKLEGKVSDGYALAPKAAVSGGALIWNYLQRELLKNPTEAWVLRCAFACEYILPYIAYTMEREHRFTLDFDRLLALIREALNSVEMKRLPHHLDRLSKQYRKRHFEILNLSGIDWDNTVFNDVGLLKADDDSFAFIHQHFRDALAGLYLVNQAEMMRNGEALPEVWRRASGYDVMSYAAELMDEPEAARLWEANRLMRPTDSSATYAMLELQRRRSDGSDSELNFSGMDLSKISLVRYMRDGTQGEKDMKLFRRPELSVRARLDEATFRSQGHTSTVNCVAVMKDGLCVSGSADETLRVWDLRTGECLRVLEGHAGLVSCVAVAEDGLCVSGSDDETLRVWDWRTGECLRVLEGHALSVNCVAVTADGLCVSGADDRTLRVWDLSTGECLRVLEGHAELVSCVAVTEDGLCVSGSGDNTLRVWDLSTGECLRVLEGHAAWVRCVAVTADGLCVSGAWENTLRVWDLSTGECLRVLKGHALSVNCVAVAADGLCISGSDDGTLRVWDLRTGECRRVLEGHTGSFECIAVTEDGLCVSGAWENTLRVWDLSTGECLRVLEGHALSVNCVAVTADGRCISGSGDNTLRVWDWRTGECLRVLEGHALSVNCIAVTADGLCVSGSGDRTLRVWDWRTGECLRVLEGHTAWVNCVAVTADGLCVSGARDRTLRVWDWRTGECRRVLEGHTDWVSCVAVTEDGLCVSGSYDGTLRVWDLSTGECRRVLEGHAGLVSCVAVTADGLCVSGSDDETLRVWDLRTGKCHRILKGHTGSVRCVAVAEDGLCVSGSDDGTLRVWDLSTGECLRVLEGHAGSVRCVAVTADGLRVSGSDDGTLRVWDIHTGKCLDVWRSLEVDVSKMVFSKADLATPVLSKTLWQNRAIVPKADSEKYARRGADEA